MKTHGVRRSGSAALDLCNVAAGRLDGFWELKLNPWDCAAGYLIVREAGGTVTNYRRRHGSIYDREVIASNGLIHEEMLAVLENTKKLIPDSKFGICRLTIESRISNLESEIEELCDYAIKSAKI